MTKFFFAATRNAGTLPASAVLTSATASPAALAAAASASSPSVSPPASTEHASLDVCGEAPRARQGGSARQDPRAAEGCACEGDGRGGQVETSLGSR